MLNVKKEFKLKSDIDMTRLLSTLILLLITAYGSIGYSQSADQDSIDSQTATDGDPESVEAATESDPESVELDNVLQHVVVDPKQPQADSRRYDVVTEENRLLKDFQDSLISTVHWSLSVVVTMLLVLAGINWFANFKFYERDKKQLRYDLESYVKTEIDKGALEAKGLKLAALEEVDSRLESRLSDFSLRFVTIDAHRDDVDELKSELEVAHTRISLDAFDALLTEMYMWKTRKVYKNMLITQIKALKLASKLDVEWRVSFMLEVISDTLDKFFIKEVLKLDEGQNQELRDALKMLKGSDQSTVAAIEAQIEIISERDSPK